tara:strand:- start:2526 stop:3737 length:1212 start_codon:yes stop_codon:yes gene_type:complete
MIKKLNNYFNIERNVLLLIKSQFFLQLIATSFFLILNIYLSKNSFSDSEIADLISYRFLAVILLSYPLGYFISFKRLKIFFVISSALLPIVAILLILLIQYSVHDYLKTIFFIWGILFTMFQVSVLPFIMRYSNKKNQTYSISLSFATHSIAMVIAGLIIYITSNFLIDEGQILIIISCFGFVSVFYSLQIYEPVFVDNLDNKKRKYNWKLILQCVLPTLVIAIGAGLTIPFINLFFFHTFNIDSARFALIGGATSFLVAFSSLIVPFVKKEFGFQKSILNTQLIAVLSLIALSTTAYFNEYYFVVYFAIFFYMLRAPLMNMAAPLTSELTMNYVGKNNQEMLSAIIAAIWSGSWFFSSQIFKILVDSDYNYSEIFYITSVLYLLGILLYYFLIKKFINNNKY